MRARDYGFAKKRETAHLSADSSMQRVLAGNDKPIFSCLQISF
jgi:hypothetical protein